MRQSQAFSILFRTAASRLVQVAVRRCSAPFGGRLGQQIGDRYADSFHAGCRTVRRVEAGPLARRVKMHV